jgi:hypothetical protein
MRATEAEVKEQDEEEGKKKKKSVSSTRSCISRCTAVFINNF